MVRESAICWEIWCIRSYLVYNCYIISKENKIIWLKNYQVKMLAVQKTSRKD